MDKQIIKDDFSKEKRKVIKEFVGFYIVAVVLIVVCIAIFGWDKLSEKILTITMLTLISLVVFAFIIIYLNKHHLEVYEDRIELSTLFHKYTIYLNEITAFYYKKSEKSELDFVTITTKSKKINLYTRYGEQLNELLNTSIGNQVKPNSLSKENNKNTNNKLIKLLFILTILSVPLSFLLVAFLGEIFIFSIYGILSYSWIFLLFIPIPLLSFICYIKSKTNQYKDKKSIAILSFILLVVFGFSGIINNDISYDNTIINEINNKTSLNIPNNLKVINCDKKDYIMGYAKILDKETKNSFHDDVYTSNLWLTNIDDLQNDLPHTITLELTSPVDKYSFDYFVLYNITTNTFNSLDNENDNPQNIIFIAYSSNVGRIMYFYNYSVK